MTKGRGDYLALGSFKPRDWVSAAKSASKGYARRIGTGLGSAAGAAIGNMIAPGIGGAGLGAIGGAIGAAGGDLFQKLTGWGDYQVMSNSLLHPGEVVPSFGPDTIRVKKREYICDVTTSQDFANNNFAINPGLTETFPWLSALANNYEQYRWNGLIFEFVSTSAVALTSGSNIQLGSVCLSSDYNAADPAYINLPQMLSTMFSNSGRPSDNIAHAVECAPNDMAQKLYYVRSGDVPAGTDIRLYDMLSFQLGVQDCPGTQGVDKIGQIWVNYDVTFCKSVQNNQVGFDLNTDHWYAPGYTAGSDIFGLNAGGKLSEGSNLGCEFTNDEIRFPPTIGSGYYFVQIEWVGAATAIAALTVSGTNCSLPNFWQGGTAQYLVNSGTSTRLLLGFIVIIESRDAYLTFSGGAMPTAPTQCDVMICQVNGELFQ